MDISHDFIPVPKIFWSSEKDQPFRQCSLCRRDLMEPGTNYLIEKAFRETEPIFEHAICVDCHRKCQDELSMESRERIRNYFIDRIDLEKRPVQCLENYGTDHERWLGHCLVKGYPLRECDEYQLYGFCIDEDLIFNGAPYMVCGEAIDEIIDLLSSETLDAISDISERLFGIDAPKDLLVF